MPGRYGQATVAAALAVDPSANVKLCGEREAAGGAAARHEDGARGRVCSGAAPDSADRQRQGDERGVRLEHQRRDRGDRHRQLRAVRTAVGCEHAVLIVLWSSGVAP